MQELEHSVHGSIRSLPLLPSFPSLVGVPRFFFLFLTALRQCLRNVLGGVGSPQRQFGFFHQLELAKDFWLDLTRYMYARHNVQPRHKDSNPASILPNLHIQQNEAAILPHFDSWLHLFGAGLAIGPSSNLFGDSFRWRP